MMILLNRIVLILSVLMIFSVADGYAQEDNKNISEEDMLVPDSLSLEQKNDKVKLEPEISPYVMRSTFNPDPMKAVWYSALCPGLGQIYNRRFWKLPVIIGGYMGLAYGMSWNIRYYKDYTQGYLDAMDNDPNTQSYLDFLPSYMTEETVDKEWVKRLFKQRKDYFRRNRDLCIISMVGLYLVSMIDAYVDAQLFHFDISPNVAMHLNLALLESGRVNAYPQVGVQCAITF